MINETDARRAVNEQLTKPIADGEWALLESQRHVERLRRGELFPEGFAAIVEQHREAFKGDTPIVMLTRERGAKGSGMRKAAVLELAAEIAAEADYVKAFRSRFLPNGLLPLNEASNWIRAHAAKQKITHHVTFIVNAGSRDLKSVYAALFSGGDAALSSHPIASIEVRYLEFSQPPKLWVERVPVERYGVLDELKAVGEKLAKDFGWQLAQGTMFILTGVTPDVSSFTFKLEQRQVPGLSRIALTVDPALSPAEIKKRYKAARDKYFGNKRVRPLSEKHCALVLFSVDNARLFRDGTYAELMAEWNKLNRKWKYKHVSNFGRDVKVARDRLAHSGYSLTAVEAFKLIAERMQSK